MRYILRHLHFPGTIPYTRAANLQDTIVKQFLTHKANPRSAAPSPQIITAEFNPVYTCGRREIGTVSPEQQDFLRDGDNAEFFEAMRGGQTTFHGPGQLVAYPIIDLKSHNLTPHSYVCLLEKTVIRTCARYGITATTTEHPGVWTSPDHKICALGIHLRRNITSHGIGLNVNTDLRWFRRIVACGLEGKLTTSFEDQGLQGKTVGEVGNAFVEDFVTALDGVDTVERSSPEEISIANDE